MVIMTMSYHNNPATRVKKSVYFEEPWLFIRQSCTKSVYFLLQMFKEIMHSHYIYNQYGNSLKQESLSWGHDF